MVVYMGDSAEYPFCKILCHRQTVPISAPRRSRFIEASYSNCVLYYTIENLESCSSFYVSTYAVLYPALQLYGNCVPYQSALGTDNRGSTFNMLWLWRGVDMR